MFRSNSCGLPHTQHGPTVSGWWGGRPQAKVRPAPDLLPSRPPQESGGHMRTAARAPSLLSHTWAQPSRTVVLTLRPVKCLQGEADSGPASVSRGPSGQSSPLASRPCRERAAAVATGNCRKVSVVKGLSGGLGCLQDGQGRHGTLGGAPEALPSPLCLADTYTTFRCQFQPLLVVAQEV